jgi:hypothetical protein
MSAVEVLKKAAKRTSDKRLATLAAVAAEPKATGSHFDQVFSAIVDMITNLNGEEETDLENMEGCEHDRAADIREAVMLGRGMNDHSDSITEAENRIVEIKDQISDNDKQIESLGEQLKEATTDRAVRRQADPSFVSAAGEVDKPKFVACVVPIQVQILNLNVNEVQVQRADLQVYRDVRQKHKAVSPTPVTYTTY